MRPVIWLLSVSTNLVVRLVGGDPHAVTEEVSAEDLGGAEVHARRSGVALDRPTLDRVVAENDKKRFAFSDDGARIRASQGHSVAVELGQEPQAPPDVLFHGTATVSELLQAHLPQSHVVKAFNTVTARVRRLSARTRSPALRKNAPRLPSAVL